MAFLKPQCCESGPKKPRAVRLTFVSVMVHLAKEFNYNQPKTFIKTNMAATWKKEKYLNWFKQTATKQEVCIVDAVCHPKKQKQHIHFE